MDTFASIIRTHRERYPEMGIPDLYKLTHHAALDPEHAVGDPAGARDRLEREKDSELYRPASRLF